MSCAAVELPAESVVAAAVLSVVADAVLSVVGRCSTVPWLIWLGAT